MRYKTTASQYMTKRLNRSKIIRTKVGALGKFLNYGQNTTNLQSALKRLTRANRNRNLTTLLKRKGIPNHNISKILKLLD